MWKCNSWKSFWLILLKKNFKWIFWNDKIENESTKYFVGLVIHVIFAILFGTVAAVLVKVYAPYACGSGVPEVKKNNSKRLE